MSSSKHAENTVIKIWDLPTRLFHWGLVVAIATSWISMKLENMEVHVVSGACVLGLLVFRLLWGIWGASTAQFHRFIPSPRALLGYLRKPTAEKINIGHSPIAALSVIAMLVAIAFQTLTGLVADDDVYTTGPLIDFVESEVSEWATSMHSTNSDVLLGLMALHVAAILFYKFVKKRSLVKPMITGISAEEDQIEAIANPLREKSWGLFLLTAAVSVAVPYAIFNLL